MHFSLYFKAETLIVWLRDTYKLYTYNICMKYSYSSYVFGNLSIQHALNILFISTNNVFLCVMISYYTYSQNSAACSREEGKKDRREHRGIKVQYVLRGLRICQTSEKCWNQEKCLRYFCCYFGPSHIRRSRRTPGCLLHVYVWCQKDCRFSSASGRQSPPLQKAG